MPRDAVVVARMGWHVLRPAVRVGRERLAVSRVGLRISRAGLAVSRGRSAASAFLEREDAVLDQLSENPVQGAAIGLVGRGAELLVEPPFAFLAFFASHIRARIASQMGRPRCKRGRRAPPGGRSNTIATALS